MKFCPNCGSKMEDTDMFCTNCGQRFPENEQQPAPVATAPVADSHADTDGPLPIITEFPTERPAVDTAPPAPAEEPVAPVEMPMAQQATSQPTDTDIAAGILLAPDGIPDYQAAIDALQQAVESGDRDPRISQLRVLAELYHTVDMMRRSIQHEDMADMMK